MTIAKPQVLIVDDDLDIRETLADVLEDSGFTALTAPNGLEALQLLRRTALVILLDLMMPIMDGYGFLEEREKDPALSTIPVAVLTASHGVERGRIGGRAPIVPKPIDLKKLVNVLRELGSATAISA